MSDSVAVVVRLFEERVLVPRVLSCASRLKWSGPLTIRVGLDRGASDGTERAVRNWIAAYGGEHIWDLVPHRHMPLSGATRYLFTKTTEDWVFILDADNMMPPDRLVNHYSLHPDAPGVCAVTVRQVDLDTGVERSRLPLEYPTYHRLLDGNLLDNLNLRIRGHYARKRLLPLLQAAGDVEVIEDWLFVLAAAWDGKLCWHDLPMGEYGLRRASLTERRNPIPAGLATRKLAVRLLETTKSPKGTVR